MNRIPIDKSDRNYWFYTTYTRLDNLYGFFFNKMNNDEIGSNSFDSDSNTVKSVVGTIIHTLGKSAYQAIFRHHEPIPYTDHNTLGIILNDYAGNPLYPQYGQRNSLFPDNVTAGQVNSSAANKHTFTKYKITPLELIGFDDFTVPRPVNASILSAYLDTYEDFAYQTHDVVNSNPFTNPQANSVGIHSFVVNPDKSLYIKYAGRLYPFVINYHGHYHITNLFLDYLAQLNNWDSLIDGKFTDAVSDEMYNHFNTWIDKLHTANALHKAEENADKNAKMLDDDDNSKPASDYDFPDDDKLY